VLILREREIIPLLSMRDAILAVERAFRAQASGNARIPVRGRAAAHAGILIDMPGSIIGDGAGLGTKLITAFEENPERNLPAHQGVVVLFDHETGTPNALLDASYLTAIRTAAVSAVATRLLAVPGARVAAIIGTGVQGRSHALAMADSMKLEDLRIFGRNAERAEECAAWARERKIPARAVSSAAEAVRGAQVINTVTASRTPVIDDADVAPGTHINAVGSCTPITRELPGTLMGRARIFVDSREGAMIEAGDILLAIKDGALAERPEMTLFCDVLTDHARGRRSPEEITVFESLGLSIEDIACATLIVNRARDQGIGIEIEFP